jgi:hypothetical protein
MQALGLAANATGKVAWNASTGVFKVAKGMMPTPAAATDILAIANETGVPPAIVY